MWSLASQQVPAFTIISTPPPAPASSVDGSVISDMAIAVPVSVSSTSGATSYRWFTTNSGGTAITGASSNDWSPIVSATQTYWVETVTDNCASTTRRSVTAYVHPLPVVAGSNNGNVVVGSPVVLSVSNYSYDSYQWLDASIGDAPINGQNASTYSTYNDGPYKVRVTKSNLTALSQVFAVKSINTQNRNYIISNTILAPNITTETAIKNLPVESLSQTTQYFDDIGRPSQTVVTKGSPGKKDLVQPVVFDQFGRETVKYLPYTATNGGWYDPNFLRKDVNGYNTTSNPQYQFYQSTPNVATDLQPYAETQFEASPLSRVLEQGAPGTPWQLGAHTIKKSYEFNVANEVLIWSYFPPDNAFPNGFASPGQLSSPTYYAPNQLYKNITKDEQLNEVIEYTDKNGKVILKKVQSSPTEWAQTYYIYNDKNQLVLVLQPEAVKAIMGY